MATAPTKKKPKTKAKARAPKPKTPAKKPGKYADRKPGELTVAELAAKEKVTTVTVRAWIKAKKIKFRRLPNKLLVIPTATFKRPLDQVESSKRYWASQRTSKNGSAKAKTGTKKKAEK